MRYEMPVATLGDGYVKFSWGITLFGFAKGGVILCNCACTNCELDFQRYVLNIEWGKKWESKNT